MIHQNKIFLFICLLMGIGCYAVKAQDSLPAPLKLHIPDNVKAVAIGDVSYTAAESVLFSTRLIQYLVREKGFRTIMIARNDWGLRKLNDYLTSPAVASPQEETRMLSEILNNTVHNTTQFAALFRWMKAYNQRHPDDTVTFSGMNFLPPPTIIYLMARYVMPEDSAAGIAMMKRWSPKVRNDTNALAVISNWAVANHNAALIKDIQTIRSCIRYMLNDGISNRDVFFDSCMAQQVKQAVAAQHKVIVWGDNEMMARGIVRKQQHNKNFGLLLAEMKVPAYTILSGFSGQASIKNIDGDKFVPAIVNADHSTLLTQYGPKDHAHPGIVFADAIQADMLPSLQLLDIYGQPVVFSTQPGVLPFDAIVLFKDVSSTTFLK